MPDHDDDLVDDDPVETDDLVDEGADAAADRQEGFLEKLRGAGVGTEDPGIVGDVGPTDIPPGTDGEGTTGLITTDDPVDHLEV